MPIWATGAFDRPRRHDGFTLVEVLVVMLIIGVLAGGVALALPGGRVDAQQKVVDHLVSQARWAAEHSLWTGRSRAWEIDDTGGRVMVRNNDKWQADDAREAVPVVLPEGMRWKSISINGLSENRSGRVVFHLGDVPPFLFVLESADARWQIFGDPVTMPTFRRFGREEVQ